MDSEPRRPGQIVILNGAPRAGKSSIALTQALVAAQRTVTGRSAQTSHSARGLTRGEIFSADGKLVASVAQEALMRPVETHG